MEKETRTISTPAKVELRENGDVGNIHGYAAVFNRDSENMGFIEQIAPGAFKKALLSSDIRGLKNHDPNLIFARKGVNLSLKEDKDGLYYEATPVDTRNYRDTAAEIKAGLLTGQSFGFTVLADKWADLDTDTPKRTITEVGQVMDVGPVAFPAYPDTTVALRSLDKAKETIDADLDTDEPEIMIMVDDKSYVFRGDERFNDATAKIESLRPESDDSDNVEEPGADAADDAADTEPFSQKIIRRIERIENENN